MATRYDTAKDRFFESLGISGSVVRLVINTELAIIRESTAYSYKLCDLLTALERALDIAKRSGVYSGMIPPIRVAELPRDDIDGLISEAVKKGVMPLEGEFELRIGEALAKIRTGVLRIEERRDAVLGTRKERARIHYLTEGLRRDVGAIVARWVVETVEVRPVLYHSAAVLHYEGYNDFTGEGYPPGTPLPARQIESTSKFCRKFERVYRRAAARFRMDKSGVLKACLEAKNRGWFKALLHFWGVLLAENVVNKLLILSNLC